MAKKSDTNTGEGIAANVAEGIAKATKVRKYRAVDGGMEFLAPDATWAKVEFADLHAKSADFFRFYGAGQKFQDYVYAVDRKKGEEPSMDDFNGFLAAWADGSVGDRSRGSAGVTMQSIAKVIADVFLRDKNGKAPTTEELKAAVTKLLDPEGNPKGFAVVKERYEAAIAGAGADIGL